MQPPTLKSSDRSAAANFGEFDDDWTEGDHERIWQLSMREHSQIDEASSELGLLWRSRCEAIAKLIETRPDSFEALDSSDPFVRTQEDLRIHAKRWRDAASPAGCALFCFELSSQERALALSHSSVYRISNLLCTQGRPSLSGSVRINQRLEQLAKYLDQSLAFGAQGVQKTFPGRGFFKTPSPCQSMDLHAKGQQIAKGRKNATRMIFGGVALFAAGAAGAALGAPQALSVFASLCGMGTFMPALILTGISSGFDSAKAKQLLSACYPHAALEIKKNRFAPLSHICFGQPAEMPNGRRLTETQTLNIDELSDWLRSAIRSSETNPLSAMDWAASQTEGLPTLAAGMASLIESNAIESQLGSGSKTTSAKNRRL